MKSKNFTFLIIAIFLPIIVFSQGKEANNWHFSHYCAFTFNSGSPPEILLNSNMYGSDCGTASVSDENGNLLFYSNGLSVCNRSHEVMLNGNDIGDPAIQSALAVPDPGNNNLYYLFNFAWFDGSGYNQQFQYSIIDMSLDNGLGGVVEGKKKISLLLGSSGQQTAVKHSNQQDVWVITRKENTNAFYSYKVTASGIENPVISNAGFIMYDNNSAGLIKVSPNGKKIATTFMRSSPTYGPSEVLNFDSQTGIVSEDNLVHIDLPGFGLEFSPDSKLFYLSGPGIFQYDLTAGTPQQILATEVEISLEMASYGGLQLGPDRKIYCAEHDTKKYLDVIHNPNIRGIGCNFEYESIYLGDGDHWSDGGLPMFIQSYLEDPEYSTIQHCYGQPTQFNINNTNGIDSVFWTFNDPGNAPNDTSTLFAPFYTFSSPGIYYCDLKVWSGALPPITVNDTVVIFDLPTPNLGNDTLFCPHMSIDLTLDASPGEQFFWNSDFSPGQPSTFHVVDTGYYRVKVKDHGCPGYDTIHVGRYNEPELINPGQTNPAHCSTADGSITGIIIDSGGEPFNVIWKDGLNNVVGNSPDLLGVPSGVYNLEITYGDGCIISFGPYSIQDIGGTQIASAVPEDDHCNLGLGEITVTPDTGNPGDYWYSINGSPFIQNGGVFNGLAEGSYTVMIKDQFDCVGSYPNNPVIVSNIPGPEFSNIIITPENSGNGMGSITVYSTSSNLTYSIDNNPFQSGNLFNNLSEGDYLIQIMDEFGCLEDSTVHVDNLIGTKLYAMAGGDRKCLNVLANSNIRVSNVSGVKDFTATLSYDGTRLRCIHFNGSLEGIDGTVYPATSQIVLEWHGDSPIPDNDTITLGDLIFETLQSGFADVNWQDPPETVFMDENGNIIDPSSIQFFEGIIEVHELPDAILDSIPPICEGDEITLTPTISGGADPVTFEWSTPNGASSINNILIENAQSEHAGKYSFKVSDRYHCANTADIELIVTPLPQANFPEINDTIWYEGTFKLEAPDYYSSYEWSTGDTIWYIKVTEEGLYSVQLKTQEGCQNLESVMMMDGLVPISVPNAFTPNGDGLNDTFSPIVDTELVRRFHLTIYNQWGQRIFESTNADKAWDGKEAMPGVYTWVISYENRIGKAFQLKGVVNLVK